MKLSRFYIVLVVVLLFFSIISYLVQILLFNRVEDTFYYMLQDFSFVPIQVLLVTLILDGLMKKRAKQNLMDKMNMVIGVFFQEIGNELIKEFGKCTTDFNSFKTELVISMEWDSSRFASVAKNFNIKTEQIDFTGEHLALLKEFLLEHRKEILNLLANPNLLEHDKFTDLLWAVFHLTDELYNRDSLIELPKNDIDHLKGDLVRAYQLLAVEWLFYVRHLKREYPYLYSIAVRSNPFNANGNVYIK